MWKLNFSLLFNYIINIIFVKNEIWISPCWIKQSNISSIWIFGAIYVLHFCQINNYCLLLHGIREFESWLIFSQDFRLYRIGLTSDLNKDFNDPCHTLLWWRIAAMRSKIDRYILLIAKYEHKHNDMDHSCLVF